MTADYTGGMTEGELPTYIEPDTDIFYHISITGGDGGNPIGILNDGVSSAQMSIDVKNTAGDLLPFAGDWRVMLRNSDGFEYDIVGITFADGHVEFDYTTTGDTAIVSLLESDLTPVNIGGLTYTPHLVGDLTFKVYREM